MLNSERVHAGVFVDARVAFAGVDGAREVRGEFADEAVVGEAEVAELEGEADEVREEGGGEEAAVDEDGPVDVRVGYDGEGGGLGRGRLVDGGGGEGRRRDKPRERPAGRQCCRRTLRGHRSGALRREPRGTFG